MHEEKQKLIVGNLKMNLVTPREREAYVQSMKVQLRKHTHLPVDIVLCPPFLHIDMFAKHFEKLAVIGAQDVFWERKGSYTGEISPVMLKEFHCSQVIVGHSERRKYQQESDEGLRMKVLSALDAGLDVIYCIGETQQERNADMIAEVIKKQVIEGLNGMSGSKLEHLALAYEPIWSIGSNITPSSNEIMEVKLLIKKSVAKLFGSGAEERMKILYGGSVNSKNITSVCVEPGMDGVLVGRESLHPDEFLRIAENM